ncbi:hypothetical protein [Furfurilactobacillus entadae]|uniref:hypothetical protein n=1 Tax=Furfurilactobacillus entadae TaxID=2922307 RepID=UPI0035E57CA7
MTKRVQRGIRQQTEYMTAAEYDKVKRHNEDERLEASSRNMPKGLMWYVPSNFNKGALFANDPLLKFKFVK